jgi:hypothetical protein
MRWRAEARQLLAVVLLVAMPAAASDAPRRDRAFHFAAGISIGLAGHTLASAYFPKANPLLVGVVSTVVIATGKEGLDALGFGTPEWADWALTVVGGLVGTAVSVGLQLLVPLVFH